MGSTTIRVDTETHARLVSLSKATGESLGDTVRDAAESLRRQLFARQVMDELAELRSEPDAWSAYIGDAESCSVADGIDR